MENNKMVCEFCNQEVKEGEIKEVYNLDYEMTEYICEKCFENEGKNIFFCNYHQRFEKGESYYVEGDNINICHEAIDRLDLYFCIDCGKLEYYYNMKTIGDDLYCQECFQNNDNVFYCEYHEEYEEIGYNGTMQVNYYGEICNEAFYQGDFSYCDECEEYYHEDDLYYHDGREGHLCHECYLNEPTKGLIKSYHDHDYKKPFFANDENENNITYGFELEVEKEFSSSIDEDKMSKIIDDNCNTDDLLHFEEDGSLLRGFEIISEPFSMDYMKENRENIKKMLFQLFRYDYQSGGRCGLHFHIGIKGLGETEEQRDYTINKVNYIVEYFKEELTILSGREKTNLDKWASFGTNGIKKEDLTKINILESTSIHDRYRALNLTNDKTIEFRIFNGTTSLTNFLGSLELVANIVEYAKNNSIRNLSEMDFQTIATYKYNDYVSDFMEEMLEENLEKLEATTM